jgi:peptidoglycan-associated lipoprotein
MVGLILLACGGVPQQQLDEAESALLDAILAKKCAPDQYRAAQMMMEKAQAQSDAGDYDAAESSARAARKLAEKARNKALLRKADCLRPKDDPTDVSEFIDPSAGADQNKDSGGLQTVLFQYNAFDLTPDARKSMASNAAWLNRNTDAKVTVEGHCDSRGSTEYNLALGEKRALVVRKYLVSLGVDGSRLAIISYGEEQPAEYGENDRAWGRNRRAEFTVR